MTLDELNALPENAARDLFLLQCHARFWAHHMAAARPFSSLRDVLDTAESLWRQAEEADVLEAFAGHAEIGDLHALRNKFAAAEQGQVSVASDETLRQLQLKNREYKAKFGFIFIVCATGKPADKMLALLEARLPNTRETELRTGAEEQAKITQIRLKKLLDIV